MKFLYPILLAAFLPQIIFAAAELPGEHAAAGKEPSAQAEKDWVDSRWQQMDVGSFLSSSLNTPAGWVAKGLSIRVGANSEASVCYDTGSPSMRAAWTAGFLKFSAGRFGLAGPPTAAGDWSFSTPTGVGWIGATVRHEAIHVHGKRVVLVSRVGETLVRETPWFENVNGLGIFSRTMEVGAGASALTNLLCTHTKEMNWGIDQRGGILILTKTGSAVTALALAGNSPATLTTDGTAATLNFPPRSEVTRVKLLIWSGAKEKLGDFEKAVGAASRAENLTELAKPGPARWLPALTAAGSVGFPTDGFAVDTLTVPYANPWKALMFCSGVDFFKDGSAAVCTMHGDVWRVTGLDEKLRAVTWKRFATGLYQPLGLRVVNDQVHVLGRDQITVLHDDNRDGEADRYENFCNLIDTSTGGHDFVTCLEQDAAGNFYYVDPHGVQRISADGKKKETLATGFRNPNGLGVGRNGVITVTPQQGNWTPSSAIIEVKPGAYYGYGGPKVTPERPDGFDAPLCWLPHLFDNSGSSQVWVPEGKWGVLGGQMLHFSWGRCAMDLVLRDVVDGQAQGLAAALPVKFLSGPMRGTFSPKDGNLYVAGSTGWQTSAAKDGSLQRVRYSGAAFRLPVAWHAQSNGLSLTFAQPLDRATVEDPGSYAVHQWNYRYTGSYGSKDYSVTNAAKEGRDEVEVRSAKLLPDGKTIFIETPALRPVMQMEVKYNLRFTGGGAAGGPLSLTINRPDGAAQTKGAVRPRAAGHQTNVIEGWTVLISERLLNEEKAATAKMLELLTAQLQEIIRIVPAAAVAKLQTVPLWISSEYPGGQPRAEYHPGAGWLRDNGRDPAMAKGVEFTNVRNFEREVKRMPVFVLHELAHAYHDQVFGFDNGEIRAAYNRAKASGTYDKVERWFGNGRPNTFEKAYAMTNPPEYFAETSEAFFGRNDFFPFTKNELERHDPEMFKLLQRFWNQPAPGKKPQ